MAIVFHLCAFAAVFDIYFRSPIVNGMAQEPQPPGHSAKRVVVVIADGGRADMFFDETCRSESISGDSPLAPFLRGKILRGETSWGVSHTRVPTESRPCHASLLAGIYEDPSAVTKGWQQNPVEFDSVINGSSAAFCFGSPDLVPLFCTGLPHVTQGCYPPEWEDFAAGCFGGGEPPRGCRRLDDWVLSEMESLLSRAKTDAALYERLHGERVVFFLHLLGLDMNGHAHRPNSAQYRQNVASVDQQVAALERLLQDFYQDNKTAFVVSADHGMSNKGSHGDGEPECTQTPLIVWGAGVRRAGHRCKCKEAQGLCKQTRCSKPVSVAAGHDSPRGVGGDGGGDAGGVGREVGGGLGWFPSPADWGDLRYIERRDLQQAQLAPLIATLVGQPSPRNNIGLVPVAYLDMPRRRQVEVLLANLRQVLRQLDRKQHLKNQTTIAMLFYPYPPNGNGDLWRRAGEIEKALAATSSTGGLEALQEDVVALFRVALAGLDYYHTYDLAFLRGLIVAAYLGGMASLAALAVTHTSAHLGARPPPGRSRDGEYRLTPAAMGVGVAVSVFVSVQQGPAQYYLYVWFAVVLWDRALAFGASTLVTAARILLLPSRLAGGVKALVVRGLAVILIECVVLGFFYRAAFSVASLALAPAVFLIRLPPSLRARLRCQWGLACLSTAVFTLLSVEFGDDLRLVVMGGLGLLGVAAMAARRAAACQDTRRGCAAVLWAQFAVGVLALAQVCGTVYVLENQWGLHVILSAANWGCLLLSLALPLRVARVADDAELRFLSLFVGWGTAYLMLAINYESLFLLAFFALLYAWLQIEVACQENGDATGAGVGRVNGGTAASASKGGAGEGGHGSEVEAALARYGVTAVLLLYLTNLGYFGTGNIASVSSFELKSVLRFMAVFDPFMMGAMLLFKIALPFVLVAAAFSYISHLRAIPRRSIECVMLFVADVMSLHFFFLVRNEGSWKEIGQSITHFGITNFIIIVLQLLFVALRPFIADSRLYHTPASEGETPGARHANTGGLQNPAKRHRD